MGGTDEPSNLIKVNTAMHAFLHKLLWEEHGNEYDLIAWKCLSGQITNEEANRLANIVYHTGREPWNKGKKGVQPSTRKGIPRSEEEKKRISERTKECMAKGNKGGRKKGCVPWNKGKKGTQKHSIETKNKIGQSVKKQKQKRNAKKEGDESPS